MALEDDISRWQSELLAAAKQVVEEVAVNIRDRAQENSPVDTGAMRASIHVSTPERSDYALAVSEAMALGGEKRFGPQFDSETWGPRIEPEVPVQGSNLYAIAKVAVPLNYATFVEHGYYNVRAKRYIAPRPFLQNAVDEQEPELEAMLADAIAEIK